MKIFKDDWNNWNTWDAKALNTIMKVPEMAAVRIALYDENKKFLLEDMLWRNLSEGGTERENIKRFGMHHPSGKYFDIDFKYLEYVFNIRFAQIQNGFVCKITPEKNITYIKFLIQAMFRWNSEGTVGKKDNVLILESENYRNEVFVSGDFDKKTLINSSISGIVLNSNNPIYICCNSKIPDEEVDMVLAAAEEKYLREQTFGNGLLEGVPDAIISAITWNAIYEPVKKRFCSPVSRAWCVQNGKSFGSYVLFEWDTFFAGLLSALQDKEIAYSQINSIFKEMTRDGMIPNFGSQRGNSIDRSQPPVGAYCVLKIYKQFLDKGFLEQYFEKLIIWNSWWMIHRDGNDDGLLEWGSDDVIGKDGGFDDGNTHQFAMYESGLDNSPMYDSVKFNEIKHTMELSDVGLNSLYALDCWAIAEIAKELNNEEIFYSMIIEYNRIKNLINEKLWNEELGIYCNKYWDGKFSETLTPTNFYPLIAGIPTEIQARRMIDEHLLNQNEFWGEYVIPSVSRNHNSFNDNDYWRGRIWGPMNFLVYEGIKRYGYLNEAYIFAKKSLNLFMKEWKEENHIHENYNSVTGDGDDRSNADCFYTWGALLAFTSVSEVVEAQPWGGLKFGNLSGEEAGIFNYPFKECKFEVHSGKDGLIIKKDGSQFIISNGPLIIIDYKEEKNTIYLELIFNSSGTLNVYLPIGMNKIILSSKGRDFELKKLEETNLISFDYS